MKKGTVGGAIVAVIATSIGAAKAGQAAPPESRCTDAVFRQFDFWLGEWDVYGAGGRKAGHNVITAAEGDCVIIENWTAASGNTGTSLNFYDRADRKWHQSWMERGGVALRLSGEFSDGHMRLQTEPTTGPARAINRITWTPASDGSVRQYWDTSMDRGKTWQTAFDGTYVKVAAANACESQDFPQLDFWIGTWDVTSAAGDRVGANRIDRVLKGCALQEHWTEPSGGEGKSLFYYSPNAKRWNQLWVTDSSTNLGGLKEKHAIAVEPGGIRFQGELVTASGKILLDRTTLKLEPDGRVRQTIETSLDGGDTWRMQFDAFYVKRADVLPLHWSSLN
jgi:hypothetical protein